MSARKKKKEVPKPMRNLNVRIPDEWHKRLERRAERIPGLDKSDIARMIFKAEWDREDARGERK